MKCPKNVTCVKGTGTPVKPTKSKPLCHKCDRAEPFQNGYPPPGWHSGQYVQVQGPDYSLSGKSKNRPGDSQNPMVGRVYYLGANFAECKMADGTKQAFLLRDLVIISPALYQKMRKVWILLDRRTSLKGSKEDRLRTGWEEAQATFLYTRRYLDCEIEVTYFYMARGPAAVEPGTASFTVSKRDYHSQDMRGGMTTRREFGYRPNLKMAMLKAESVAEAWAKADKEKKAEKKS